MKTRPGGSRRCNDNRLGNLFPGVGMRQFGPAICATTHRSWPPIGFRKFPSSTQGCRRSRKDAVVERFKVDAFVSQLLLNVFVAVDAQLGGVREVGAELQEERTEIVLITGGRSRIDLPASRL